MAKSRKVNINFMIEHEWRDGMEEIISNPVSYFESLADLIRYCLKQQLPLIKNELKERQDAIRKDR